MTDTAAASSAAPVRTGGWLRRLLASASQRAGQDGQASEGGSRRADAPEAAAASNERFSPPGSRPNETPSDPAEAEALKKVLAALDGGLAIVPKVWSSGSLTSKITPDRARTAIDALDGGDSGVLAELVVNIASPEMATSPVVSVAGSRNPMRESAVRGVMQALMHAVIDVEMACVPGRVSAAELLIRLRGWVIDPMWRQPPRAETKDPDRLGEANLVLWDISRVMAAGAAGSAGKSKAAAADGPQMRLGIVVPLMVSLNLLDVIDRMPRHVLDLSVAGFEKARAAAWKLDEHDAKSEKDAEVDGVEEADIGDSEAAEAAGNRPTKG